MCCSSWDLSFVDSEPVALWGEVEEEEVGELEEGLDVETEEGVVDEDEAGAEARVLGTTTPRRRWAIWVGELVEREGEGRETWIWIES
jgi:hypothetical protein